MPLEILIVEDEFLLSLDLEDMLSDAGYFVVGNAADMHEALAIADRRQGRIDLAVMDVNLARGTNGLETAALLRQMWNIPSLFVSGNLDEDMRYRANMLQPLGFVGKPYSEHEVLTAIAALTT